jgi:pilus assembly protein FimV
LQQENAILKSQVEDLTGNVTTLNDNLLQSEQRLHQLEAQLSDLLLQFQQQRATVAALSGTPTATQVPPQAHSAGSMISQVNAADLQPAPAPLPSWWVHLLYWLGIGGVAIWAIREHFWPRRLATVDLPTNAVNPPVERNAVSRSEWRAPAEDVRPQHTSAPITIEQLVAEPVAEEDAPEVRRTIDDPVDASISAGVFVAFGRFDEAERLLLQAIEHAPERTDLQLQLLDVYIQADRGDAFSTLADDIERNAQNPEVIAELAVLRENFSNKH